MIEPFLDTLLQAIAASPPAAALKASHYAYPIVNAVHILGLATLFGAILGLDLRILGLARAVPVQPLAALLPKVAASGLALAAVSGLLLFTVQPVDYAGNTAFLMKVGLVVLGTVHAVLVHRTRGWASARGPLGIVTPALRVSAGVSIAIWVAAVVAGRFIGFE